MNNPKSIPNILFTFYFCGHKKIEKKEKGNFINCSSNFNVTLLSY